MRLGAHAAALAGLRDGYALMPIPAKTTALNRTSSSAPMSVLVSAISTSTCVRVARVVCGKLRVAFCMSQAEGCMLYVECRMLYVARGRFKVACCTLSVSE
jgi:hypothetical protein